MALQVTYIRGLCPGCGEELELPVSISEVKVGTDDLLRFSFHQAVMNHQCHVN